MDHSFDLGRLDRGQVEDPDGRRFQQQHGPIGADTCPLVSKFSLLERLQSMRVRAVVVPACLRGALLELVGAPSCRRAVSANPLQIPKHFRMAVSQPIRREATLREALVQKVGRGVILSRQRMKLGYRKIKIPRDLLEFPVIETRFADANEFGCDGFYPPDQGAGPRCSLHAFGNDHWNTSLSAHPIRANTDHLGVDLDQKGSVRYTALLKSRRRSDRMYSAVPAVGRNAGRHRSHSTFFVQIITPGKWPVSERPALGAGLLGQLLGTSLHVTPEQHRAKYHEHRDDADGNNQRIDWHWC